MSSFDGHLNGVYSRISLDRFDHDNLKSTLYWLSHAHSDHMVGLSSNQFAAHLKCNKNIRIYCTETTKKLVSCMKNLRHLEFFMTSLNVDEPTVIELPSCETTERSTVTLTAITAGHCPGSAMLLIEGEEGTVLYTGDFRFDMGMTPHISALHDSSGDVKHIDALYCDTTFLNLRALKIPSRSDCEEEIINQVREHTSKGDNYHILLKIKAKLGYENVFRILYDNLGIKTHIEPRDAFLYSKLPEILQTVTPDCNSQIHACCRYIVTSEEAIELTKNKQVTRCKALVDKRNHVKILHLSTMWFVHMEEKETYKQTSHNTVRCCYSFHSSFSEIEDFIRYLNPKTVYASVVAMRSTREKTQKLLQEILLTDSQNSLALEKQDSWKSVYNISMWWLDKKSKDQVVAPPSAKKPRMITDDVQARINTSFCSTKSRESTPELDLWSDDDDNELREKSSEKPLTCCQETTSYDNNEQKQNSSGNVPTGCQETTSTEEPKTSKVDSIDEQQDFDSDNEIDVKLNTFYHTADPATAVENADKSTTLQVAHDIEKQVLRNNITRTSSSKEQDSHSHKSNSLVNDIGRNMSNDSLANKHNSSSDADSDITDFNEEEL